MTPLDPSELPEWMQREADDFIARDRAEKRLAMAMGLMWLAAVVLAIVAWTNDAGVGTIQ